MNTEPKEKAIALKARQRIIDFLVCCELREVLELVERGSRNAAPVNLNRIIERVKIFSANTRGVYGDFNDVINDMENVKAACLETSIGDEAVKFMIIQVYGYLR